MSNVHDIVLTLNSSTFESAIDKAISLLSQLDHIAKGVNDTLKSVQTSLSNINLNNLTSNLDKAKSATESLGNDTSGINKLQNAIDSVSKSTENFRKVIQDTNKTQNTTGNKQQNVADPKQIEALAKAQQLVAQGGVRLQESLKSANIEVSKFTEQVAKKIAGAETQKAKTVVDNLANSIAGLGTETKKTAGLGDFLQRGFEIGLAHAVGAISVGANVIRSLVSELVRNLSISLFVFSLRKIKDEFTGAAKTVKDSGTAITNTVKSISGQKLEIFGTAGDSSKPLQRASDTLNELGNSANNSSNNIKSAFTSISEVINLRLAGISIGFLLLGKLLDNIGDKFLQVGTDLAKTSGDYSIALTQLNAVVDASEKSTGRALGTNEEWKQSLIGISKVSGKSIEDLSQLASSFIGIDKSASLSAQGIQSLVESAAILSPLFRNQIEVLTNFRAALLGNFRAINSNIFVANSQADANQRYVKLLVQQGNTQEQANKIAENTNQIEKNRAVIIDAAASRVNVLKNSTDLLNVSNLRLQGTLNNVLAVIGKGAEGILARFNNLITKLLEGVLQLPEPLLKSIGALILITGTATNVGGKILKLVGYIGLLVVAFTALNAVMLKTIPILGVTLSSVLGNIAVKLGAPLTQLNALPVTFGAAIANIARAISTSFLPIIVPFIAQFALITTAIGLVIAGFSKFSDSIGGMGNAFSALFAPITTIVGILTGFVPSLELAARATALYTIVLTTLATMFSQAAFLALKFAQSIVILKRYFSDTEELKKKEAELEEQIKKVTKAQEALNVEFGFAVKTLTASSEAIKQQREALELLNRAIKITRIQNGDLGLSEEQQKAFDRLKQSLQDQITQLRIRKIELTDGKGAAAAERINAAIEKGIETIKKAGKEGEKLSAAQEASIRKQLLGIETQAEKLASTNAELERQNALYKELVGSVVSLDESFIKNSISTKDNIALQNSYNQAITQATDDVDGLIKNNQLQNEVLKAALDIERQIAAVQDRINRGKIEVGDTGQLIHVQLDPGERDKAEALLAKLTARKEVLIDFKTNEVVGKRIGDFLTDIAKKAESIGLFFRDNTRALDDENGILQKYLDNLSKGVVFADQQNEIETKLLAITQKLRADNDELVKLKAQQYSLSILATQKEKDLLQDQIDVLSNAIKRGEVEKGITETLAKRNINVKSTAEFTKELLQQKDALIDQLSLIELRSELFKQGILRGDFNKVTEQISALTSQLDNLFNEQLKIKRQGDLLDPKNIEILQNIDTEIQNVKNSLKELNFVKDIQDALNTITGAIEDVLTNGVRAVLEGTQTIKDLFKNMASNIFLSLSKFFAQKAIDGIKEKFNELASSIANSGLGQAVAKFFNIPVGNLGKLLGKAQTPQEQLTESTKSNTTATIDNTSALRELTASLKTGSIPTGQPGVPATTVANPFPEFSIEDFNRFNQNLIDNFDKGIAATEPEIQSFVGSFFDDFSTNLGNGLTDIEPTVKQATDRLIESIRGSLENLGGTFNTSPITTQGNVLSTVLPPPKELPNLPTQEFADKFNNTFAQDFQTSLERIAPSLQFNIDDLTTKVESSFTNNIKQFYNTVTTGFRGFFFELQTTVSGWLEKLKDMVAAGGTGGEGGKKKFDWAGLGISIAKAVGSVYSYGATNAVPTPSTGQQDGGLKKGYAGGGMIPGKPSAKDNTWTHVATGEYVTNSEAVKHYGTSIFDALNNMTLPKDFFDNISASGATSQITAASNSVQASNKQTGAWNAQIASTNERPINVTIIDKANKLDPAAFKMKPSEVTQIFVEGMRKDRVIRKVIHEDMKSGKA